jgi:NADH pyrophosphatase NudC (nudix superfamily)
MKPFRYCPACASRLGEPDAEGTPSCPSCGRSWYCNPAPTAGCLILGEGRGLITIRGRDPLKGRADLAGGFLRCDEDPITGLKREVDEELGVEIDVSLDDLIHIVPHTYGEEGDWLLSMGFVARFKSGEPSPADDVAEINWITADEIDGLEWAWPHDRELARKVLAHELPGTG